MKFAFFGNDASIKWETRSLDECLAMIRETPGDNQTPEPDPKAVDARLAAVFRLAAPERKRAVIDFWRGKFASDPVEARALLFGLELPR